MARSTSGLSANLTRELRLHFNGESDFNRRLLYPKSGVAQCSDETVMSSVTVRHRQTCCHRQSPPASHTRACLHWEAPNGGSVDGFDGVIEGAANGHMVGGHIGGRSMELSQRGCMCPSTH